MDMLKAGPRDFLSVVGVGSRDELEFLVGGKQFLVGTKEHTFCGLSYKWNFRDRDWQ